MLSTKNLPEGNLPKTLLPGNHVAKITSIELAPGPAYKANSYQVIINLEGQDLGPDFEGFFKDSINKTGERYAGQVGKVRMSEYPFADGETNKKVPVSRDRNILRGLQNIAKVLGKEEELNQIEVETIEEFVPLASEILSGDTEVNWCLAGKEYQNRDGYTNYDLFLPPTKGLGFAYEAIGATPSKLLKFDPSLHIKVKEKAAPVEAFEPKEDNSFNL